MFKLISFLIEAFFWLLIFLSPALLFAVLGVIAFAADEAYLPLGTLITAVGVAVGVIWAERIRRTYGCSAYMSNILATPDIWPIPKFKDKKETEHISSDK